MYDQAVTAQKNAEPVRNKNLASASGSEVGIRPYTSKSEFSKERNNIKFQQDTMYREMVESRMSITDWNTISQF